jgi:hypothetical protein
VEFNFQTRLSKTASVTLFDAKGKTLHFDRVIPSTKWTPITPNTIAAALADAAYPLLELMPVPLEPLERPTATGLSGGEAVSTGLRDMAEQLLKGNVADEIAEDVKVPLSAGGIPRVMFGIFGGFVFLGILLLAARFGMLSNGFSTEPWERIGILQRVAIMSGIVASSLLATLITHRILKGLGVALMPASECIAKARSLTLKAREEYVSRFTTATGDADVDTLLEDLPARGSATDAKRFLESNRDLQTAKALYKKAIAIEAAGWVPGDDSKLDQQTLNTAIAHNQLGYNYRLIGDFEKALESLGEVYGLLDQLPRSAAVELERASVDFHFGLVMMARYRRLGRAGDRSSSLNFFEQSIERLAKIGYDCSGVQKLAGCLLAEVPRPEEEADEDEE